MKKKLSKLSNNEIGELLSLCTRICSEIETFSHVSEHLPQIIDAKTREFHTLLCDELNKREEAINP